MIFLKCRRASVTDVAFIMIILFVAALMILFSYKIAGGFKDKITAMPDVVDADTLAEYNKSYAVMPSLFDKIFLFLYVGLLLSALVGAWFVDAHPFFAVISIILLIFYFVLAMVLNNVFYQVASSPMLGDQSATFPIMTFIMNHLLIFSIASGILIMLALYAKPRGTII